MHPHVLKENVVESGEGGDAVDGEVVCREITIGTAGGRKRRLTVLDALRMTGQAETFEIDERCGVEVKNVEEAESTVKLGDLGYIRTDA